VQARHHASAAKTCPDLRNAAQAALLRTGVLAQGFVGLEAQMRGLYGEDTVTKDDIIRMAREAGFAMENSAAIQAAEHFYALAIAAERNKLAAWMRDYGYATGHGDTMEQLCDALGTEIVDSIEAEVAAEREACAKVCERDDSIRCLAAAQAIRARGSK